MIDEKKLVEEIKMLVNTGELEGCKPAAVLCEVYDRIREMPKAGEWIPCRENLPEDDRYILLSFENFTIPVVGRYETDDEGGAFYAGDDGETCTQHDLFVNAWMPLPEPYKEGNENGRS